MGKESRPSPSKIAAITEMKPRTKISDLWRFMGIVNQLGKFSRNIANLSQPLRQLLSSKSVWLWGPEQI